MGLYLSNTAVDCGAHAIFEDLEEDVIEMTGDVGKSAIFLAFDLDMGH